MSVGRTCAMCAEWKTAEHFRPYARNASGLFSYCKPCFAAYSRERKARVKREQPEKLRRQQREVSLKRLYGITLGQYEAMLLQQDGVCAICHTPPGEQNLAVDHDHATGAVRALLCGLCNKALGLFQEDVARLEGAIDYLNEHRGNEPVGSDHSEQQVPQGRRA